MKKIRLRTLSTFGLDRIDVSGEDGVDCLRIEESVMKSAGDENERLGGEDFEKSGGGGKRKDLVDQVFTRFNDESELPPCCDPGYGLETKEDDSEVGVDGGVRAEANTSN